MMIEEWSLQYPTDIVNLLDYPSKVLDRLPEILRLGIPCAIVPGRLKFSGHSVRGDAYRRWAIATR